MVLVFRGAITRCQNILHVIHRLSFSLSRSLCRVFVFLSMPRAYSFSGARHSRRASLEKERSLRRWEHESLLAVLREGNVAVDDRCRPSAAGPPSKAPVDAAAAEPTPQENDGDSAQGQQHRQFHQQHWRYAHESGAAGWESETGESRGGGEEERAWRRILAALQRFLQSHSRPRRGQSRGSDDNGGGRRDGDGDPGRRRRQQRYRQRQREVGQQSTSGATGSPPVVGGRGDGSSSGAGRNEGEDEAYSDSCCSSRSSSPSSPPPSPSCSGSSGDDDSSGSSPPPPPSKRSWRGGGAGGSQPPQRPRRPRRRRRRNGEVVGTVERGCKGAKPDGTAASRGPKPQSGREDPDADADEVGAFSGALAAALRELLSSTLGVPEEGVREAPLPELVRALQREWEGLLEGLVSGEGGVEWILFLLLLRCPWMHARAHAWFLH